MLLTITTTHTPADDLGELPLDATAGDDLYAYFGGPKHGGAGAAKGLDDEDAGFLETLLVRYQLSTFISLDRSRLRESHEAWVWVILTGDDGDTPGLAPFHGFGPYPRQAVLTWNNTD